MDKKPGSGTTIIHGGHGTYDGALPTEPVITPIYTSTTFAYDTVDDHQNSIFEGQIGGLGAAQHLGPVDETTLANRLAPAISILLWMKQV